MIKRDEQPKMLSARVTADNKKSLRLYCMNKGVSLQKIMINLCMIAEDVNTGNATDTQAVIMETLSV